MIASFSSGRQSACISSMPDVSAMCRAALRLSPVSRAGADVQGADSRDHLGRVVPEHVGKYDETAELPVHGQMDDGRSFRGPLLSLAAGGGGDLNAGALQQLRFARQKGTAFHHGRHAPAGKEFEGVRLGNCQLRMGFATAVHHRFAERVFGANRYTYRSL